MLSTILEMTNTICIHSLHLWAWRKGGSGREWGSVCIWFFFRPQIDFQAYLSIWYLPYWPAEKYKASIDFVEKYVWPQQDLHMFSTSAYLLEFFSTYFHVTSLLLCRLLDSTFQCTSGMYLTPHFELYWMGAYAKVAFIANWIPERIPSISLYCSKLGHFRSLLFSSHLKWDEWSKLAPATYPVFQDLCKMWNYNL